MSKKPLNRITTSYYEAVESMGQFWVRDLTDKGRIIAMCTRKEDAYKIKRALCAIAGLKESP